MADVALLGPRLQVRGSDGPGACQHDRRRARSPPARALGGRSGRRLADLTQLVRPQETLDMASGKRRAPGDATGLRQGLATYGDAGFSLFLRKAFIKAGGYSDDALDRPIVGITNTFSDYNPCHGNVPDL